MNRLRSLAATVFEWFVQRALAVNVRLKILGLALGVAVFLGVTMIMFLRVYLARARIHDLQLRAVDVARENATRSADMILTNDLYGLFELLNGTVENNPDVRYAFALDAEGHLLAHTFGRSFPPELLTVNTGPLSDGVQWELLATEEGRIHDVAAPILDGRVGVIRVGFSERRVRAEIASVTARLAALIGIAALGSVGLALFFTYVLTRPVQHLLTATEAVQRGEFTHHVNVYAMDEFGQLGHSFNAMIDRLAEMEVQRAKLLRRILTVQEAERSRIAHELHDHTGQVLSALLFRLRALAEAPTLESAREEAVKLRTVVSQTLDEVRLLAFEMRPAALYDLGLAAALDREARIFSQRYELSVRCHIEDLTDVSLSPEIETTVYRIVREALTNTARHAHAENASVLVQIRAGTLIAIVEDDGVGFDVDAIRAGPLENYFGLLGMEERARLVGGTITVESTPGTGTSIYAEIPLKLTNSAEGTSDADPSLDRG